MTTTSPAVFRPAPDPDVVIRTNPAAEAREHGLGLDEIPPAEDRVGWALHFGAQLTFADDMGDIGDGRDLHYTLSIGPDMPRCGTVIKTVTPAQIRTYGQALVALADRAEARASAPFPIGSQIRATTTWRSATGDRIEAGKTYTVAALDCGGWPILDTDEHDGGGWAPGQFEAAATTATATAR